MSQESSTRASRPRSRLGANREQQPTAAQLAMLGIKVRDFAIERTLPPVRTVYRQPRQIQPSVPRQLHREDTEPLDNIQPNRSDSRSVIVRTVTEPIIEGQAGPSMVREMGGFFEIDGSTDRIVNSQPFRLHPETPGYSQAIQPLFASQETGAMVPTPTVTPNGSLQWKEHPSPSGRNTPPSILSRQTSHLPGFSSPLTPLPPSPPSREGSSFLSNRSPSMDEPYYKRRKISIDNNSRPGLGRYYLRKRSPNKHGSPSKSTRPAACSPAPSLFHTVSVRSDHLRRKSGVESDPSSSRPLHTPSKSRRRP